VIFFFQAEDGIRDRNVTGVQTCALPISENLVAKANAVRPTDAQLDWQELELTAFIHFGMNTFYDQEWGDGTEDPSKFQPTEEIDVDGWVRTLRDTGHRLAIVVVKHHDGCVPYPPRS